MGGGGARSCDLLIMRPVLYHCATAMTLSFLSLCRCCDQMLAMQLKIRLQMRRPVQQLQHRSGGLQPGRTLRRWLMWEAQGLVILKTRVQILVEARVGHFFK